MTTKALIGTDAAGSEKRLILLGQFPLNRCLVLNLRCLGGALFLGFLFHGYTLGNAFYG